MSLYDQLLADYRLHRKSRTQKHALYPNRFEVSDALVSWNANFPDYNPMEYNAPIVLDEKTPWADPQEISRVTHAFVSFVGEVEFNQKGIPLNPVGRTGICGRGVLGKWGANFAVDAIITTLDNEGNLFVLTITRKDTGEMAFPGGMVDEGEDVFTTRNRELAEELSLNKDDLSQAEYEKKVSQGYVDDPRNTDNAWLETTAIHSHLAFEAARKLVLKAGDDAADFSWIKISMENVSGFYASHALSLMNAVKELLVSNDFILPKCTVDRLKNEFGL